MSAQGPPPRGAIPSVDRLLRHDGTEPLIAAFGRPAVTEAIRDVLSDLRESVLTNGSSGTPEEVSIIDRVAARLEAAARPTLRPVFNLTGTVLHTNLGRAALPESAIEAVAEVARGASNLEYDLASGRRGDRDVHIEDQICQMTGAEAATVVNNNAAAVMLVLNSLALRKEVPVSRGELIEIGGSFRIPNIMTRSGCRLREVGTTNRTHLHDFAEAIGPKTGLVMKVHTSNYAIEGFTAAVPEAELSKLCADRGVPFVVDLGSGTLTDLRQFGLPYEPTAADALADGADVVTFSGDKLLGGPQAGIVVGKKDLIAKIKRNPMKRALRLDKMTIAALSAVLRLYADPDRLTDRLPTLRHLARATDEIAQAAGRIQPVLAARLEGIGTVDIVDCSSQIGSGALPIQRVASTGLAITPVVRKRGAGTALKNLAAAFRDLPIPVIGRIQDGSFILDLRCLDDEASFVAQLPELALDQ